MWRRRKVRLTAAWTAAAVAVAGGLFWVSGGYDAWRHDRALDSACDGDLAAGELRALLGGTEVTTSGDQRGGQWLCKVRDADPDEDGVVRVTLAVVSAHDHHGPSMDGFGAPLGNGWTGTFDFAPRGSADGNRGARAALLLDCGPESGDGLVATVDAHLARGDFSRAETRSRLTTVLTKTAMSYAQRTGCAATPGKAVEDVGVSVTSSDHKPFAAVSGSCAGILDAPTAARWGVRTAVETATGRQPVETCTFGGTPGPELYRFTASYGPFVGSRWFYLRDETLWKGDRADGHYMLAADCPGAGYTSVYEVVPRGDGRKASIALDHPALRAALKRFAERSAKAHGCGEVWAP